MSLSLDKFVATYGGVYEHSPWIATDSWKRARTVTSTAELAKILAATVDAAPNEQQLALIQAHPDLAGRLAISGALTAESTSEQASAGLDQCSESEYQEFQRYNAAYIKKFKFPFVMAVRGSNRTEILAAFKHRLENNYADEFDTAIREIHKIAAMRLEQLFS